MRMFLNLGMAAAFFSVSCTHMIHSVQGQVREQMLGQVPDNRLHEQAITRCGHIGWIIRRGPKVSAVVDGREGPVYDEINVESYGGGMYWLDTSWYGEHWAYVAR